MFIIGGEGFIGSHICRRFLGNGHHVTVYGPRFEENLLSDIERAIQKVEGDILDFSSLQKAMEASQADVVIHLAAYGQGKDGVAKSAQRSPQKAIEVNITGFHHVVVAAKTAGIKRMVWSGSTTVFGFDEDYKVPTVPEDVRLNPATFYGLTKVMNEAMTRYYCQDGIEICGLRLPLVYGPGRWYKGAGSTLVDIFERAYSPEVIEISGGDELIDLMYVKDVAKAFYEVAVTKAQISEVYNVKSHTTSMKEIVEIVKEIVPESQLHLKKTESSSLYPLVDCTKIEQEIGFVPDYSIEEACRDYLSEVNKKFN
nr:NAD(P)-dependent oxidoreductase [Halalkalibacter oceani]